MASPILFCTLCIAIFITTTLGTALYPRSDGFVFEFDGKRHLSYGIVPAKSGETVTVAFYDVDFISRNCDDVQVEIYQNGYLRRDEYLISKICDPQALQDFQFSSHTGFYIQLFSALGTQRSHVKVRFSAAGGTLVTQESFQ